MRSVACVSMALACLLAAAPAAAGFDDYGLGKGSLADGTRSYSGIVQVNAYAPLTTAATAGSKSLCLGTIRNPTGANVPNGFQNDRLILVHQSASSSFDPGAPTESLPGSLQALPDGVGHYELARIIAWQALDPECPGGRATLDRPLLHSYAAGGAQAVSVPEFEDLTLNGSGVIQAEPWDGERGGIVAFLVSGTLHLEGPNTHVQASGAGFRGGKGGVGISPCNPGRRGASPTRRRR